MQPTGPKTKKKWVFYGRWALIPSIIGILIVAFVIVTEGKYATWTLWIAVPLMMIGLGYIFIINAIASLIAVGRVEEPDEQQEKDANP
jgi:hypothetical protein